MEIFKKEIIKNLNFDIPIIDLSGDFRLESKMMNTKSFMIHLITLRFKSFFMD